MNNLEEGSTIEVSKDRTCTICFLSDFGARTKTKENPIVDEIRKNGFDESNAFTSLRKITRYSTEIALNL